jgi:hypothetical protein
VNRFVTNGYAYLILSIADVHGFTTKLGTMELVICRNEIRNNKMRSPNVGEMKRSPYKQVIFS